MTIIASVFWIVLPVAFFTVLVAIVGHLNRIASAIEAQNRHYEINAKPETG